MKTVLAGAVSLLTAGLLLAAPIPRDKKGPPPVPVNPPVIVPAMDPPPMVIEEPYEPSPKVVEPLPSDALHARMLLDPESVIPVNDSEFTPELINALRYVAIQDEVMNDSETWMFNSTYGSSNDSSLAELKERYYKLKDAPPAWKQHLYPKHARMLLELNREYKQCLEERLIWENDRADIIRTVIDETEYLYTVWSHIETVTAEYSNTYYRRLSLKWLEKELGENPKELPPNVPIWRFQKR